MKKKPDGHRTLTPQQVAAQRAGGRRVAPGLWLDANGHVHWSVPELLALVALPDTPANREAVTQLVIDTWGAQAPDIPIIRQDEES